MEQARILQEQNPLARFGATIFSDQTEQEMLQRMGDIEVDADITPNEIFTETSKTSGNIDWSRSFQPIQNQGQCGSCWAFGAVETLEDRICIQSQGEFTADLSEQNMVSCDWVGFGCSGGYPLSAFAYLSIMGVPTEECVPYTSGQSGEAWGCSYKCEDSSVSSKRYRCEYPWINFTNSGIKKEIAARGPAETAFSVYEDFINYKGGIYHHTTGGMLGGHAVKIVGWGVEEGVNYWIVANSWSTSWGEDGYFRIKEGDSGFASSAYSCTPYAY
jgi:cathepsin B